jgi:hydroxyacylglutathione hydrolase
MTGTGISSIYSVKTMVLKQPFGMGSVNCYLLKTDGCGCVLIDCGASSRRRELETELEKSGCGAGSLRLIVLTHGDFDHTGNAAYLQKKFRSSVAVHRFDAGMIERGDIYHNRKRDHYLFRVPIKIIPEIIFRFGKPERLKADLFVDDGFDLSEFGLNAHVLHIPGHSKGSIGILTGKGELFCGDLLTGWKGLDSPRFNRIIDDRAAAEASLEKIKKLKVKVVYPGHGRPFSLDEFLIKQPAAKKQAG